MVTKRPTPGQLAIVLTFAISCFGLLLFLWKAFGGAVPLSAEGYRVKLPFTEASQLAPEADVRIASVSVGRVTDVTLDQESGKAIAEIELDSAHAPLPQDSRAILRQKTLLGETYVELSPGSRSAPSLEEGETLAQAQVSEAVQLDEIFRTFDRPTRAAFQAWMQGAAAATQGRGADISAAIANLEPFASDATRVLRILDTQDQAVSALVQNTGQVFSALSERRGQLRGLVENGRTVFGTTARRNASLRQAIRTLPGFLEGSRATVERVEDFALGADPVVQRRLRPVARQLSPTVRSVGRLAPELTRFFGGFEELARNSTTGLPALRAMLGADLPPVLAALDAFTNQLQPIAETIPPYKREIAAFLANVTAATQASTRTAESGFAPARYLRTISPLGPEALAAFSGRLETNRPNPYPAPGGYDWLATGLRSFETRQCEGSGLTATLNPADAASFPGDLFDRLKLYAFADTLTTADVPAPPCVKQPPFSSIGHISELSDYLHIYSRDP